MPDDTWSRIETIFHAAAALPAADRRTFVVDHADGDTNIERKVLAMLDAHDADDGFLEQPAEAQEALDELAAPFSGRHFGGYEVGEAIASGGMGWIYRAEQVDPRRTVALKIIRPGSASPDLLARFRHEAQVLARLQHHGIAQVIDSGETDVGFGPQPFFAMEFIDGLTLTAYADAESLGRRERLELLMRVCDAVQHAHHKGVIHRDLKPDNILVTADGQPKVLDFGVARITDEDMKTVTMHTNVGQIIGTVPYMSPEQVGGDPADVDTRTDVYALGVIMYQLLAGQLPHDLQGTGIHEAIRRIREDDPPSLSTIVRDCRGDLETIVARALEKDKERRYQSAAELGADIRRHLEHRPILAEAPTLGYRLHKWARRNRHLVRAGIVVLVVAIIGIAANANLLLRMMHDKRAADRTNTFWGLVHRSPSTPRDSLRFGAGFVAEHFAGFPEAEAQARVQLADGLLGYELFDEAEAQYRRAFEIQREALDPDLLALAQSHLDIGTALWNNSRFVESESWYREALRLRRLHFGRDDRLVAQAMVYLGASLRSLGKYDEAEGLYREALAMKQRLDPDDGVEVGKGLNGLGVFLRDLGHYDEAEDLFQEALHTIDGSGGTSESQHALYRARAMLSIAMCRIGLDDLDQASTLLEHALRLLDTPDQSRHRELAVVLFQQARIAFLRDDLEAADAGCREALSMLRAFLGEQQDNVARIHLLRARINIALDEPENAREHLDAATDILHAIYPENHWRVAEAMSVMGTCLAAQGRHAEAMELLTDGHDAIDAILGPEHPVTIDARERLEAEQASDRA